VEYLPLEPTKDKYLVNKTVGVDYGPQHLIALDQYSVETVGTVGTVFPLEERGFCKTVGTLSLLCSWNFSMGLTAPAILLLLPGVSKL